MKKILFSMIFFFHYSIYSVSAPIGLKNLGATCYMNSTLQCLYQIEPLTNFLITKGREFYKPKTLTLEYINFLKKIPQQQKISEKEMEQLCNPVFEKFFRGSSDQQDASDFLAKFLDNLTHEDMKNEKKGKEFIPGTEIKKNPIGNLFFSLLHSTLSPSPTAITHNCPPSVQLEGIDKIELPIQAETKTSYKSLEEYEELSKEEKIDALNYETLENCFNAFIYPEILEEENKYRCADGNYVEAIKQIEIHSSAPFFIIVLKRFAVIKIEGGEYVTIKLSHPVSFPLHSFDLKPYMTKSSDQAETKYDLVSFVQHSGRLHGGHYTSYVKANGQWFYCNDTAIIPHSEEDIQNIAKNGLDGDFTPYILFYKRQDIPEEPIKHDKNGAVKLSLNQNIKSLQDINSTLIALSSRQELLKKKR